MNIPANIDEAVTTLIQMADHQNETHVFEQSEEEFLAATHHAVGRWIRNRWGLWFAASSERPEIDKFPLYYQLWCLGFRHPDDMSACLLRAAYRDVNNINYDPKEDALEAINFWIMHDGMQWGRIDNAVEEVLARY